MKWRYLLENIFILLLSFPVAWVTMFLTFKRFPTIGQTILGGLMTFMIIVLLTARELGSEYIDRLLNRKTET
jgi:hypothetical protein